MIDINNIAVEFHANGESHPALTQISLHVDSGEYLAMLGPNGSGKSTLVRALCGMVKLSEGHITMLGKEVVPGQFGYDFFGEVSVVFQEPQGQFLMPSVELEIMSMLQNLGLPLERQRQRFEEIVELFGLRDIIQSKSENLSGGQMQIVNLAGALAVRPKILILDEPTTFLDRAYRERLISFLDKFHNDGMAILHVTQFPDEALRASRIIIFDQGELIFDGDTQTAFADKIFLKDHRLTMPREIAAKKIFGFDFSDKDAQEKFLAKISSPKPDNMADQTDIQFNVNPTMNIISVKNIEYHYPKNDFSLQIESLEFRNEEITGIVGAGGSGKSTLAYLLAGLYQPVNGRISFNGKLYSDYTAVELRRNIGITWQLPDLALIGPTVLDDVKFGLENLSLKDTDMSEILRQVGLDGFEDHIVDTLSGGEKRKLMIAGALATGPSFMIMDEPSAFLDPFSLKEMTDIIRKARGNGIGIIIFGHDHAFLSNICDRIIGLASGKMQFDTPAVEYFSSPDCIKRLGMPSDPMIDFRYRLSRNGIVLSSASIDPARIAEDLRPHIK